VRFVPPAPADPYYEVHLFETGQVRSRAGNLHDLFNALAWLAFPRTKALINALHAEEIPRERGRRGRRRDLLTLLDEGGALVQCDDAELIALVRGFRWKELFWDERARVQRRIRFRVLGHATLEQALEPWPGIACKAIFVPFGADADADADAAAHAWLAALPAEATPDTLAPLPVFGYPGWLPAGERAEFYDDTRYFRPFRERPRSPRGTPDTDAPVPRAPPRDAAH
jgi:DNA-binding MarR family transcriptional regulator